MWQVAVTSSPDIGESVAVVMRWRMRPSWSPWGHMLDSCSRSVAPPAMEA